MVLHAPAKLNLCLYVGPHREDGLHELCSLFEPLSLQDRIEVSEADRDEVVCPDVEGENLVTEALAGLRDLGWDGPRFRIEVEKAIPVAAGLGGGSADAAAVLRLALGEVDGIAGLAERIGADVPSQLEPSFSLVGGAGERVERLPAPGEHALVLLPDPDGLPTGKVFAEADRLGLGRDAAELDLLELRLREAAVGGASPLSYRALLLNDLEPAALSLRPRIGDALAALRNAGAEHAMITGSGPTAFGVFGGSAEAEAAARKLGPEAIVCTAGGTA